MNQATDDFSLMFSRSEAPVFTVSDEIAELARKNEAGIFQHLRATTGTKVAKRLNTSDATVTRFGEWEIKRMAQILAACGLKAVPISMHCLPADQMRALVAMADELKKAKTVAELSFDEVE